MRPETIILSEQATVFEIMAWGGAAVHVEKNDFPCLAFHLMSYDFKVSFSS